ncbi:MAG: hypothetical protein CMI24_04525 [Opitutae bacterium]|nr:hypothetical protein [Opitutae bacterium]MEC8420960.1 DUF1592 domain-containing protein [Verrucomicrobiota bacterium]
MIQRFYRIFFSSLLFTGLTSLTLFQLAFAKKDFSIGETFKTHCIECHGAKDKVKGDVDLSSYTEGGDIKEDPELLQMVLEVIDFGEMPPEENDPIPPNDQKVIVAELKNMLREAINSNEKMVKAPIRRMTRFQYANAVKDLLGLKVEVFPLPEKMMRDRSGYFNPESGKMPSKMTVSSRPLGKSGLIEPRMDGVAPFPQDLRAEHGYDTQGDHLSLSPLLMEDFFRLSRSIVQSPSFNSKNVGTWKIYFEEPGNEINIEDEIEKRLGKLLTHAFRRPIDKKVSNKYFSYAKQALEEGKSFLEVMKEVLSAVLASPRFLYLYDVGDAAEQSQQIENINLASRLSFFLWGSLPDEDLLDSAKNGTLSEDETLVNHVERMLLNHKVKRFCDSFPTQWLQLDRIISAVPDEKKYKDFYYAAPLYRTTMDMMMEPLLLFETVLIEDRSVLELIDSNYTFRSPRLRKWYGEEPKGKLGGPVTIPFARQPVADRRHGGVITNGAVMTMTSGPLETKPITRGAWIAGVIFNSPPPPPPAEVPPLPEDKAHDDSLTLRERFSDHRERADCAGCHEKLDPLGFALENFDPVGRWRQKYENGRDVDSGGTLFRKHEFSNVVEFKDAILKEKDRFVRALAGHLLAFGLGRELIPSDSLALDGIVERVKAEDYSMKSMIHAVVASKPFLGKNGKLALHLKP